MSRFDLPPGVKLSAAFSLLELNKKNSNILSYALSQTSLNQVPYVPLPGVYYRLSISVLQIVLQHGIKQVFSSFFGVTRGEAPEVGEV